MQTAPISHANGKNQRTTQPDLGSRRDTAVGEGRKAHPTIPRKFKTKTKEEGVHFLWQSSCREAPPPAADGATPPAVAPQLRSRPGQRLPRPVPGEPRRLSPSFPGRAPPALSILARASRGPRQPRECGRLRSGTALSLPGNEGGVNCSRAEKIAIVSRQRRAAV